MSGLELSDMEAGRESYFNNPRGSRETLRVVQVPVFCTWVLRLFGGWCFFPRSFLCRRDSNALRQEPSSLHYVPLLPAAASFENRAGGECVVADCRVVFDDCKAAESNKNEKYFLRGGLFFNDRATIWRMTSSNAHEGCRFFLLISKAVLENGMGRRKFYD